MRATVRGRATLPPTAPNVATWFTIVLLSAASQAATARSDHPFDDEWCEYRTSHVRLVTDIARRNAQATLDDLDRFRTLYDSLYPAEAPGSLPVTILLFGSHKAFLTATDTLHFAGFTIPGLHEYRVLLGPGNRREISRALFHEYAHYLIRNRVDVSYPLWYEEGLATYLGAVNFKRGAAVFGAVPAARLQEASADDVLSWQELTDTAHFDGWDHRHIANFYDKSWALVHFIRLGHYVGFEDLRPALADYLNASPREFEASFGRDPDQLGLTLRRYLGRPRLPGEQVSIRAEEHVAPPGRCLSEAERDYELAASLTHHRPDLARTLLEPWLAGEPSADVLVVLARVQAREETDAAQTTLERALALDPDNASALIERAGLRIRECAWRDGEECPSRWQAAALDYRAALTADPTRFDAAYGLGVAYLHVGKAGDALNYLRVAYQKVPWAAPVNFYLGEGYRLIGDRRSEMHLENARNWAQDDLWRARADAALARLSPPPDAQGTR
jgi:tetratricopeptide (TPR) repeat protein